MKLCRSVGVKAALAIHGGRYAVTLSIFVAVLTMTAAPLGAQTAHFSYAQSTIANSLSGPSGTAVDNSGNVYIAEPGLGEVVKETLSNGSYTQNVFLSGLSYPSGIAIDGSGNIYISCLGNSSGDAGQGSVVKTTLSGGSSAQSTILTGFNDPAGIAVDSGGNLYIAERSQSQSAGTGDVIKETLSGGSYTPSVLISGLDYPTGLAVDSSGNIYIAAQGNGSDSGSVLEETWSAGTSSYTQSTIAGGSTGITLNDSSAVAVDASGNVYISDAGNGPRSPQVLVGMPVPGGGFTQSLAVPLGSGSNPQSIAVDESGNFYISGAGASNDQVLKVQTRGVDFGLTDVATTTPLSAVLTFTFDTGGALSAPTVLTTGTAGLDFADASTGTCTTNGTSHSYNAGDTCTVNASFTPKYAGLRTGAVVLKDISGNTIARAYLYGVGTGPQITFNPGIQTTLGTLSGVTGITVDAAGSLYAAANSALVKLSWDGSNYGAPVTLVSGLNSPESVAVDGAGNIFIGEGDQLAELPWTGSGYGTLTEVASGEAQAVAVDGNGNLYYGGGPASPIHKLPWNGSGYGSSITLGSGDYPQGVAVDAGGNVLIAFAGSNEVVKVPWDGRSYGSQMVVADAGSIGLSNPQSIALDGNGDIYVADTANKRVVKVPWNGGSYGAVSVLASMPSSPVGIALDQSGNIYVAAGNAYKIDVATPPTLTFAATALGSTSSDSPRTITLANIGNVALNFPVPSTGGNPSLAASFTLDNATTCPELVPSSSPETLTAGASCALAVDFAPAAVGSIAGSLVVEDDNLNAAAPNYTTQTISLSGTGQKISQSITFNNPGGQTLGSSPTLTATASSGLTVTFTSSTTGICTITSGGTLTLVATGTCTINADQAGNSTYEAATTVPQSFAVKTPPPNFVVTTAGDGTAPALNISGPLQFYNGSGEIDGFQFTATKNETVSALGIFAGPSLTLPTSSSFAVGLWKSDGTLLASASVTSADTAIGSFYYHSITPVTLTAGQSYVVGAQMGSGVLTYFGGSYTMADGIQYVGSRWITSGSLTMPTDYDGAGSDPGYIGANFLVGTSGGDASDCTPQTTPGTGTDAACSLRDALLAAGNAGAADISFDSTAFATAKTITLASGLTIPADTTIVGPGANLLTVDGNNNQSVFTVSSGTVSLSGITIAHGFAPEEGGGIDNHGTLTVSNCRFTANSIYYLGDYGAGIFNSGTLTVTGSTFDSNNSSNPGGTGGGIFTSGTLKVVNSTFYNNNASALGGGIFINSGATATIINSTFSGNSSGSSGGGIYNAGGTLTLQNSIVAGNTATSNYADIDGSYTDGGGNVASNSGSATSTITPELTPLGNYGGPTQTILPLPGSPAICAGTEANANGITTDQRGLPRITTYSGTGCVDAGAAQTNYSLSFTSQPGDGAATATIAPSPTVQLNESGSPIALSGASISMSAAAGTLSGTTTESTGSNGQAIFSDLSISPPQSGDTLTASLKLTATDAPTPETTSATSSTFNLTGVAPTITFTVSDHTYGDAAFSVSASSDSAGSITYSVVSGPATISGSTVTLTGAGTVKLEASQAAAGKYFAATQNATFNVAMAAPSITWNAPSAITYGIALSSAQLNATSPVAGSFAYSPAAGTVLGSGIQTLSVTFTPTDTTDYTTATASVNLTVETRALTVSANNSAKIYGTANPAFSGSITGAASGDSLTESFTTTATASSNAGTYAIVPSVTGANLANYAVSVVNGTLTVTKASTAVALASSETNANLNANVTFTATVTSTTTGMPTGAVEFLDGSTVLGSATLNSTGVAAYTTAALTSGTHTITAVYTGNGNFIGSTTAVAQQVTAPDYSLIANTPSLALRAGQTGRLMLTFTPVGGFVGRVNFRCSGLPANASCSFAPLSLTADGSNQQQTSQLTITTEGPNTGEAASNDKDGSAGGAVLAGIFWLPGLLFGCFLLWERKKLTARSRQLLGMLIVVAAISGMIGCGFGSPQAPSGAYTVQVTATSGGSASGTVSHTATFTLTITQ